MGQGVSKLRDLKGQRLDAQRRQRRQVSAKWILTGEKGYAGKHPEKLRGT